MDFISVDEEERKVIKMPSKNVKKNKNSKEGKTSNSYKSIGARAKNKFNSKDGGIIYLGHIPHGFYEDEMESYFNQFGKVLATTVARSKKTGRSRGYGFVKFKDEEVAKIAAETMNNYLMFNRIIKCRYIPPEERSKMFFKKVSVCNYPRQKRRKIELKNKINALSKLTESTYLQKVQKKINEFKNFFEKNGIDFTFKLNNENCQIHTNSENETKTSSVDLQSESENEINDYNGVLEIDESDNEIFFKTPPKVKKVIKRSSNSLDVPQKDIVVSNNSLIGKVKKNNSNSKKKEQGKKITKVTLQNQTQEKKKTGKNLNKTKKHLKLLKKSLKTKKEEKITANRSGDNGKLQKEKVKINIDFTKSKKEN